MTTQPLLSNLDRRQLLTRYRALPPCGLDSLVGTHRGQVLTPSWQRPFIPLLLASGGLGGWWGKEIAADGHAVNLVQRGGSLRDTLPMVVEPAPSFVDGRPATRLVYPASSRWPWPIICDEIRRLDDTTCLGVMVVKPVRWGMFIFTLRVASPVRARRTAAA